jgi:hypothetical protein
MARMRAVEAAIHVLEQEGITALFGVPGAAINPFYAAMRKRNSLKHTLARHVEGASHMAEGYTRAAPGLPVPIWLLAYIQPGLIQSQSCALSAKLRARACTKKISRQSTLSRSSNPLRNGRQQSASLPKSRAFSSRPSISCVLGGQVQS